MSRTLALDIGDRRIGVALSDPQGILASPLTIFERKDDRSDIQTILDLVNRNDVKCIIIGLPVSMDGTIGTQAEKVKAFAEELRNQTKVPVEFRDERLSTVSARRLQPAGRRNKKIRHDAVAAAIVLQSYLDEIR